MSWPESFFYSVLAISTCWYLAQWVKAMAGVESESKLKDLKENLYEYKWEIKENPQHIDKKK